MTKVFDERFHSLLGEKQNLILFKMGFLCKRSIEKQTLSKGDIIFYHQVIITTNSLRYENEQFTCSECATRAVIWDMDVCINQLISYYIVITPIADVRPASPNYTLFAIGVKM